MTVKATAATTDGSFSLVKQWGREGAAPPWHIHRPNDEIFLVFEGHISGLVRDGDGEVSEFPSGPGDTSYLPKGTEHSFRLDEESEVLVTTFQPGSENYFVELETPVSDYELPPESGPTREKMADVAAVSERYGMEITGPPPE
jgi:quercetin dioxygenase-like cupin family protein